MSEYTIRRGQPAEAEALTRVAHQAKAALGYPADWIERWRGELTLTPEYVGQARVYVAEAAQGVAGLASLELSDAGAVLEHVWVSPAHQRRGVGQALVEQALSEAARAGFANVQVTAEPSAVGFYQRLGGVVTGSLAAPMPGAPDRTLPRLTVPTRGC